MLDALRSGRRIGGSHFSLILHFDSRVTVKLLNMRYVREFVAIEVQMVGMKDDVRHEKMVAGAR
jgi:hypothetical protein